MHNVNIKRNKHTIMIYFSKYKAGVWFPYILITELKYSSVSGSFDNSLSFSFRGKT